MPPIVPSLIILYPQNTQVLDIEGLVDEITGDFLNAAAVTATLYDSRGTADSVLNNIAMGYVAASNGRYQGVVSKTFNAALGSGYTIVFTAGEAGIQGLWSIPAQVKLRTQ